MDSAVDIDYHDGVPIDSPWGDIGRDLALCLVSLGSKFLLNLLNSTTVVHAEGLEQQVRDRSPGIGLLTVCNHTRCALTVLDLCMHAMRLALSRLTYSGGGACASFSFPLDMPASV